MEDITQILSEMNNEGQDASQRLFELLYHDLRRMAKRKISREAGSHTLQATALVNEAYLRLLGNSSIAWRDRVHFFATAAEAMRRILIEHARAKNRQKRGGGAAHFELNDDQCVTLPVAQELLDMNEALQELEKQSPQRAEIVKLRFFAGLTMSEIAELLSISKSTVERHWAFARAWLKSFMNQTSR